MKLNFPKSVFNWVSLVGGTIATISFFMIVFLFFITAFLDYGSSYLGLIIYIVLPGFLITGLILIPIGMYIQFKKEKKKEVHTIKKWPLIDLNIPRNRKAFVIFSIVTVVFLFASAIGSYEAFHYTESVQFCGTVCHTVMKPEFTAYQNSPHARVTCVECHVGSGADWYVKSKLSGLYQVYAVTLGEYPTPIPTPIKNLRPARETCEQCHWPEKFIAPKIRLEKYYLADEVNTEWNLNMTLKIGGASSASGLQEGIHWHINPDVKIEYAAIDESRESIPWVKYTNMKMGKVTIFEDEEEPLEEGQLDSLRIRKMDCMDCHNRPSHNYRSPSYFINNAMASGAIPPMLPEIKSLAMEILSEDFETKDAAFEYIKEEVSTFYQEEYPEFVVGENDLVNKAIDGIQKEFAKNIFPEMKVKWEVYPNNIGHLEFNGCFRCHSDTHVNNEGEYISKDCNMCHSINLQGQPDNVEIASFGESLEFKHPVDIEEAWKEMDCIECHTASDP